jgi:tRNA(fMet)-specific endonuclease VapC
MRYMLDTNILIYLLKNRPESIVEKVNSLDQESVLCMSFFTYAELLKGAERSTKKSKVLRSLAQLTRQIHVAYNANKSLCEYYAIHFTSLKEAGTPIGANDLWIACHALAKSATLVTHNTCEFKRVVGLKVEDWVN